MRMSFKGKQEQQRHKVLEELKLAIEKGWDGPISSRKVPAIISAKKKELTKSE